MKTLLTLNEAPCGSERTYSGLRLAGMISRQEGNAVRMFLIGDAASSAHRNQKVPQGFYNVEVMPGNVPPWRRSRYCGACLDACGLGGGDITEGAHRSTLAELTERTAWADKVMVF